MAQFPRTEPQVVLLSRLIAAGLASNPAVFPSPPVAAADLQARMADYAAAQAAVVAAQAAAEQATAAKNETLQSLIHAMKTDLRYAENTVNYDDDRLKLLGWSGRRPKTALEVPGQCRSLESVREGAGWILLDWKEPADGGKVAAYKIQRRLSACVTAPESRRTDGGAQAGERSSEGAWTDIGSAMKSETTLTDQERGKEWEYRVLAANKAGEGPPSNTVMAVL